MNSFRKDAAIKKFLDEAPILTDDQLADKLEKDDKAYTVAEQQEIFQAIREKAPFIEPDEHEDDNQKDPPLTGTINVDQPQQTMTHTKPRTMDLIVFSCYKVKPVTGVIIGADRKKQEILKGYQKVPGEPIKVSHLTQRHADLLNAQTPNNETYWFKDGEEDFKDASLFF